MIIENQVHEMRLNNLAFRSIYNGVKTIEVRLFDEKRRKIKLGDTIIFSHNEITHETITTIVLGLSIFSSFKNLFNAIDGKQMGWEATDSILKKITDIRQIYSEEDEAKNGVVGIHIIMSYL